MKVWDRTGKIPEPYRFIAVLWLSFLMAGVATVVCFALIDPENLAFCAGLPDFSRMAGYTSGFLLFWFLTACSSLLTTYFLNTVD